MQHWWGEGCVQHWWGDHVLATGGMSTDTNSQGYKELSQNMGAGKSATRGRRACVRTRVKGAYSMRATGGMGADPNSREFKELSRNIDEGENATRRAYTHISARWRGDVNLLGSRTW